MGSNSRCCFRPIRSGYSTSVPSSTSSTSNAWILNRANTTILKTLNRAANKSNCLIIPIDHQVVQIIQMVYNFDCKKRWWREPWDEGKELDRSIRYGWLGVRIWLRRMGQRPGKIHRGPCRGKWLTSSARSGRPCSRMMAWGREGNLIRISVTTRSIHAKPIMRKRILMSSLCRTRRMMLLDMKWKPRVNCLQTWPFLQTSTVGIVKLFRSKIKARLKIRALSSTRGTERKWQDPSWWVSIIHAI